MALPGWANFTPSAWAMLRRVRIDVDQFDLAAGHAGGEPGRQAADAAGADHRDAVAGRGARIPQPIERRLQIRGEYGARRQAPIRAAHTAHRMGTT